MKCPLCHKDLIVDEDFSKKFGKVDMICSVRRIFCDIFSNIDVSHFRIQPDRNDRRIIFAENYRILEQENKKFEICIYKDIFNKEHIGNWNHIMTVPPFDFSSEAHLVKKIKMLKVFS